MKGSCGKRWRKKCTFKTKWRIVSCSNGYLSRSNRYQSNEIDVFGSINTAIKNSAAAGVNVKKALGTDLIADLDQLYHIIVYSYDVKNNYQVPPVLKSYQESKKLLGSE